MRWASVLSSEPEVDHALDEVVAHAGDALGGDAADLALVFVSDRSKREYERVAHELERAFPDAVGLGCSARSVIGAGRELEEQPGLALVAASLPGVGVHADVLQGPLPSSEAAWRTRLGLSAQAAPHFVLLPDPLTCDAEALVHSLDVAFPHSVKLGGLASGGAQTGENALLLGETVHGSGAAVLALEGPLRVEPLVAQGCRPVGVPGFVTRSGENRLLELDGRAPLELLQELYEQADELERALYRTSLFLGVGLEGERTEYAQGDFLIRNLVGSDAETGAVAVAAQLREGQVVQFHLRDAATSAADLERCLARGQLESGSAPEAALLFSCLGRGRHLYGRPDHDTDAFRRHFGEVPLGGFFCNGEIGPVQGRTFLHAYTSAFALFSS